MSADLALFDIDEPAPPVLESQPDRTFAERDAAYRWLCQRGWTRFPDGNVQPAWVCASCGSVQANDWLMSNNRHTEPRDLASDGAGGWLFRPRTPFGCDAVMHGQWLRFCGFLRRGDAATFDADWWQCYSLPWAPTREAAEALGAA